MPVIHLHSGTWQMKRQAILLSSTFSDFKGAALVIEEAPEILGIVLLFFFVLAFGRVTLCFSHLSFFRKSIYGWVLFSQTWLMTSDNSEYRSCLAHQCYLPNNQSPKGMMLSGQTTSHGTVSSAGELYDHPGGNLNSAPFYFAYAWTWSTLYAQKLFTFHLYIWTSSGLEKCIYRTSHIDNIILCIHKCIHIWPICVHVCVCVCVSICMLHGHDSKYLQRLLSQTWVLFFSLFPHRRQSFPPSLAGFKGILAFNQSKSWQMYYVPYT